MNEQTEILKKILEELKAIKKEVADTKGYVLNICNPEACKIQAKADSHRTIERNRKPKIDAKTEKEMASL